VLKPFKKSGVPKKGKRRFKLGNPIRENQKDIKPSQIRLPKVNNS